MLYCMIIAQIQECILAIMDATVDKRELLIHHELLEVDDNGHLPASNYRPPKESTIEIVINNDLEV